MIPIFETPYSPPADYSRLSACRLKKSEGKGFTSSLGSRCKGTIQANEYLHIRAVFVFVLLFSPSSSLSSDPGSLHSLTTGSKTTWI